MHLLGWGSANRDQYFKTSLPIHLALFWWLVKAPIHSWAQRLWEIIVVIYNRCTFYKIGRMSVWPKSFHKWPKTFHKRPKSIPLSEYCFKSSINFGKKFLSFGTRPSSSYVGNFFNVANSSSNNNTVKNSSSVCWCSNISNDNDDCSEMEKSTMRVALMRTMTSQATTTIHLLSIWVKGETKETLLTKLVIEQQRDKMVRVFFHYLVINNNENSPNSIKLLPK